MREQALNQFLVEMDGFESNEGVQQVLDTTDCRPCTFEFLKGYIGLHLIELFGDLFPNYTPQEIDALIRLYRANYLARGHSNTRLYPGVAEGLAALSGRKSTATTKGSPTTRAVLEQFGLLPHFEHVQGTDGFPCKPAPDVIHAALKGLGAQPEDCLLWETRPPTWKPPPRRCPDLRRPLRLRQGRRTRTLVARLLGE